MENRLNHPFSAAGAALLTRGRVIGEWLAAAVTALILVGLFYGVVVVMLGVAAGAIPLAVVVSLIALLVAPLLVIVAGDARWSGAPWLAGAGIAFLVIAALTVHPSSDHPLRSWLVYAENADSSDAWLGTFGGWRSRDQWTREVIGENNPPQPPMWTSRLLSGGNPFHGRKVERVPLGAPSATIVQDTVSSGVRRVALRVKAPAGTVALAMHARGRIIASSIDGRVVDTTRFRRRTRDWTLQFWGIPDSGTVIELSVPAGGQIGFELAARRPGIPPVSGVQIPARPPYVVPSQTGDVNIVYRQWRF
jgi:hypothetical protein